MALICSDCGCPLTEENIRYKSRWKTKHWATCKSCFRTSSLIRHRDDKRRYRASDPEGVKARYREWQLQNTYGLSVEQFDQMLADQGGLCAICGADNPQWTKDWHVDHDHETGVNRGILCHKCNLMLGLAVDNVDTLLRAVAYLKGPTTKRLTYTVP